MTPLDSILIISLIGATYSYFIYPAILLLLPKRNKLLFSSEKLKLNELPNVTFIITAYNEENLIKNKIINTLNTTYPKDKMEILVASDGSTDRTNKYISEFTDQAVTLVQVNERKGKENAQLSAIKKAKGEIIIFSDVATQIDKDAIQYIVLSFQNKKVGAISSEDRFISENGEIVGEGAYVKYEMWLRKIESSVNSLVGLSGSFFAARKDVCEDWNTHVPSDFNGALNSIKKGYVAISNPKLFGYYPNIKNENNEYARKVRTVIRGMSALANTPSVLNPIKFGLFSFQIFSHKLMRWLVPFFLISLFISNIILWNNNLPYILLLLGQFIFYGISILGYLSKKLRKRTIFKVPFFFIQVNIAIAHSAILYLQGKRITKWEPSKR